MIINIITCRYEVIFHIILSTNNATVDKKLFLFYVGSLLHKLLLFIQYSDLLVCIILVGRTNVPIFKLALAPFYK